MAKGKKSQAKTVAKAPVSVQDKMEVKVVDSAKLKVNEKVEAINLTPWGGENSYNLKVVKDKYGDPLNDHNNDGKSNFKEALEGLKTEFPNLKKVSLVVGWYADTDGSKGSSKKSMLMLAK